VALHEVPQNGSDRNHSVRISKSFIAPSGSGPSGGVEARPDCKLLGRLSTPAGEPRDARPELAVPTS